MTPIAIAWMCVTMLVLWGGLIASIIWLRAKPEVPSYPPGGDGDEVQPSDRIVRDL